MWEKSVLDSLIGQTPDYIVAETVPNELSSLPCTVISRIRYFCTIWFVFVMWFAHKEPCLDFRELYKSNFLVCYVRHMYDPI